MRVTKIIADQMSMALAEVLRKAGVTSRGVGAFEPAAPIRLSRLGYSLQQSRSG